MSDGTGTVYAPLIGIDEEGFAYTDVDAVEIAESFTDAFGAAVVVAEGVKPAFRVWMDGHNRIATSTVLWAEGGDGLPGQPTYDVIPTFAPPVVTLEQPLTITGGRSFIYELVVTLESEVVDVTGAHFVAQIRPSRSAVLALQFTCETINATGGEVRLSLTPVQTQWLATQLTSGVWDMEIHTVDGYEWTVVPESKVTVTMGVSQGEILSSGTATAGAIGLNPTLTGVD